MKEQTPLETTDAWTERDLKWKPQELRASDRSTLAEILQHLRALEVDYNDIVQYCT